MDYLQYSKSLLIKGGNFMVLNLIINGILSILAIANTLKNHKAVLNLVIRGIPSIQTSSTLMQTKQLSFKPCYKWNTFNT